MAAANKFSDVKVLGELIPLNQLERDKLYEIAEKSTIREFKAGEVLFRKNSKTDQTLYLLSGTAELTTPKGVERIRAGSKRARIPLHDGSQSDCSATAKGPVTLLMIDTELLDLLIHWSGNDNYDVEEFDAQDPGDWMTSLLQHETVVQLSPDKIQTLMSCIQPLEVKAGQVIVQQGDTDRCYYLISHGRCRVTRHSNGHSEPVELARLSAGDAFGEEALIANTPRGATVTMLEDGLLLRLNHADFDQHIKHPLLDYISHEQALEMKKQGAEILDVRTPERFRQNGFGANLPLANLRAEAATLDKSKTYVVCCDDGKQSGVAGFLLRQKGFNVHILENGLNQSASKANDNAGVVNIKQAKSDVDQQRLREQLNQTQAKLNTLEQRHTDTQQANQQLKNELTQLHKKAKQVLLDNEAQRAKQESVLREQIARLEEEVHKAQTALEHTQSRHSDELNPLHQQVKQQELDIEALTLHSQSLDEEIIRLKSELTQAKQQSVKGSAQEQQYQQDVTTLRNELQQSKTRNAELDKTLKQAHADLEALQRQHQTAQSETGKQQKAIEQLRSELDAKTQQLVDMEKETAVKFERSAIEFEQLLTQHSEESETAQARVTALERELADNKQQLEAQQQRLNETSQSSQQLNTELHQARQHRKDLDSQVAQLRSQLEHAQQSGHASQALKQQLEQTQADLAEARQRSAQHQQAQQQNIQRITDLENQLQSLTSSTHQREEDVRKPLESRISELEQQLSTERQKAEHSQRAASDTDQTHQQTVQALEQQLTDAQSALENKTRQLTETERQLTTQAERLGAEHTRQLNDRDAAFQAADRKTHELEQALNATQDKLNAVLANNETLKSQSENSHKLSLEATTLRSRLTEAEQQLNQLNAELETQRHHNELLYGELNNTKTRLEQAEQQAAQIPETRELISEEKLAQLHQTLKKETQRADAAARIKHQLEQKIDKLQNERNLARQETAAIKEKLETYINMSKAEAEMNKTLEKLGSKELRNTEDDVSFKNESAASNDALLKSAKLALADIPDDQPIIEKQLRVDDDYSLFAEQNERRSLLGRWWLWAILMIGVAGGGYAAVRFVDPSLIPWNISASEPDGPASSLAPTTQQPQSRSTPPSPARPVAARVPPPSTGELRQMEQQARSEAKKRFEERLKLLNENSPPGTLTSTPQTNDTTPNSTQIQTPVPTREDPPVTTPETIAELPPVSETPATTAEFVNDNALPATADAPPALQEETLPGANNTDAFLSNEIEDNEPAAF